MAQLERTRRSYETPKTSKPHTFEQLLKVEESYWPPTMLPTDHHHNHHHNHNHGEEECLSPSHNRKSVLAKVKETAKKLKHSLSGRKNVHENDLTDDNTTPTSPDTFDNDEPFDDPEYLGAPMYESEAAPETLKENARQHPRAVPVVAENHRMPIRTKPSQQYENNNDKPVGPNMTVTEAMSEKFAPAYFAVSDATHKIASKIGGLTITPSEALGTPPPTQIKDETAILSPQYKIRDKTGNLKQYATCSSPQTWDKGVSVKEYFMNKLEPGEDERALSQAITEAISPRRSITNNTGVVDKVKEAVSSFFWNEEPSNSMRKPANSFSAAATDSSNFPTYTQPTNSRSTRLFYPATPNSTPLIPISSNAHKVHEEENHGKILQTN